MDQLRAAETWVAERCPEMPALWRGERYRHDRIRVAYLSADYHSHATAYLAAGLFEAHDRSRFETVAISFGPDDSSEMRERLRRAFDRFIDVRDKSDHATATLLREMEIDIAVDLKGFTQDARPGILAFRPAPVQVNYLGHPGTMGARYIDYLIADRRIVPEGHERHYREKIVCLPDSYQANDRKRRIAERTPTRAEEGLPDTGFVFCSFNGSFKITPEVFRHLDAAAQIRRRERALAARRQSRGRAEPQARSRGARRAGATSRLCAAKAARRALGAPPSGRPLPRHASVQRPYDSERCAVGGASGARPAPATHSRAVSRRACCSRLDCRNSSRTRSPPTRRWR